jgi:hypothetical protein
MNHGKYVTTEEVSTSTNLLPKYLEEKIKASISVAFCLNLSSFLVWSNMSDHRIFTSVSTDTIQSLAGHV